MKKHPVFTAEWLKTTACAPLNTNIDEQLKEKPLVQLPVVHKGGKTRWYVELILNAFAAANGLVCKKELQFDRGGRHWRADWALFKGVTLEQIDAGEWEVENQVALIEMEGIGSKKSRHTEKAGYTEDSVKYTAASLLGWTLLRYTYATSKNLSNDLAKLKL